ncbi:MAG: S41 family peptidase [Deltaproteobacteria bacterium]|nr:S41 family peptidase [Deltaproteobacteria bacterium]MCX7953081.1 S41 family peptidase [Deltaproteobacteria bacterium]
MGRLLFLVWTCFLVQLYADDINYDYLRFLVRKIKQEYVRPVNKDEIFKGAVQGILLKLDSYSQYLTKTDYDDFLNEVEGFYTGIGVEIKNVDDSFVVVTPLEDSPAMKAGLRPGDLITKVNGESLSGKSLFEVVRLIRGPKGSTVELEIIRPADQGKLQDPFKIIINRDEVALRPVKGIVINKDIAYIRVSKFLTGTHKEIKKFLRNNKDVKGLILDLRLNPGGLLQEVLKTADLFMDKGLILETRSRHREHQKKFFATDRTITNNIPIVVLIDKGSASASEILAGALKDNGFATIVGEKSFGKGSVQTSFELPGGDALILTTAYYYTKSGIQIEGNGITPTFEVKNDAMDYCFAKTDWIHNPQVLFEANDPVFKFAVEKVSEMISYTATEKKLDHEEQES